MNSLFERNVELNHIIKRNITSLRISEDLFDDLYDLHDEDSKQIAIRVESRIKKAPSDLLSRSFYYTTAIEYPFKRENYINTRYSNGQYACWYGSLTEITTIYETAYHALKSEQGIEGLNEEVIRERAVYNIHCHAILIDLSEKSKDYPELIFNDYTFTQQIGRQLQTEGHPGLLAPSARHAEGLNVVAFNKNILSNPLLNCYLTYFINPNNGTVRIEKQVGKKLLSIAF
ncbi:MAG: RES family NAD+ phosphorylase [Gammaproteobacteria bacterium]